MKDRPCAVVLVTAEAAGETVVTVLPITHTPPAEPEHAVEMPRLTKQRLGLDTERSWIMLTEANRFVWPGPDLRPAPGTDPASVAHGLLPGALFTQVKTRLVALARSRRMALVSRTE